MQFDNLLKNLPQCSHSCAISCIFVLVLVGLNVVPLYIEEQFIKTVELDTPCSIVNSTVKIDLLPHCYGKHQGFITGRYGGGICRDRIIIVPERVAKGVGIPQVHLLHLEIFVGFESQNLDFSRENTPVDLRTGGNAIRLAGGFAPKRVRTHAL